MSGFPLPGSGRVVVAAPAPGAGPGYWAGAPSAALDEDGTFVIAYRVRNGHDGIDSTVVARSVDGENLTTLATLDETYFGAQAVERPTVVRLDDGRWRLYVCCATPGSKHWWIGALDADELEGWAPQTSARSFPATTGRASRILSSAAPTGAGRHGPAATRWTSPTRRTG